MRMARPGWGSGIASGGTGWPGSRVELLFRGGLDGAEDIGDFAVEGGELEVNYAPTRVQDDIDRSVEGGEIFADGLAHAALDSVAIDGLTHDFADGESDARACGVCVAKRGAVRAKLRTKNEEVRHLFCELLAAGFVDALIVGVFA
jgi:hypothetical protein